MKEQNNRAPETLSALREEIDTIDREMQTLFCKRMQTVSQIADYKGKNNLPVADPTREKEMIAALIQNVPEKWQDAYRDFLVETLRLSRREQITRRQGSSAGFGDYAIVKPGIIQNAGDFVNARNKKVGIVTDSGTPAAYAETVAKAFRNAGAARVFIHTTPGGESNKTLAAYENIARAALDAGFDRGDVFVAVGGGIVCDLTGFAAATLLRGVEVWLVPTTLLAMADAAVGGKNGVNLDGFKNILGTIRQPRGVLIDPDTLSTLPDRTLRAGFAEIIKIAACLDEPLFCDLERLAPTLASDENGTITPAGKTAFLAAIPDVLARAVALKMRVVREDEREAGLRRVLNFGHTIGHALESDRMNRLPAETITHGEAVALGMLPMTAEPFRGRLRALLTVCGLPSECPDAAECAPRLAAAIGKDKKRDGGEIATVRVTAPGKWTFSRDTAESVIRDFIACYS